MGYEDWARAFHGHAFLRRSAERHAAFLLPRLRPGMRVLDIGCGPGTITAGLADRVAPGEVVGIDRDAEFVATARSQASGRTNLRFEAGDGAALDVADASFDVAFLHAVLQHVESPAAVLAEVARVVRPGGIVAIGDADLDGFLIHPRSDDLLAALALDRRIRRSPDVGRRLPELVVGAGFTDVEVSVVANVAPPAAGASAAARLEAPPFAEHAVSEGWARDAADLADMAAAWRAWDAAPGALFVTMWVQVLAVRSGGTGGDARHV